MEQEQLRQWVSRALYNYQIKLGTIWNSNLMRACSLANSFSVARRSSGIEQNRPHSCCWTIQTFDWRRGAIVEAGLSRGG